MKGAIPRDSNNPLYRTHYPKLKTVEEQVLCLCAPDTLEELRANLVAAEGLLKLLMNAPQVLTEEETQEVAGMIDSQVSNVLSWALWRVDDEAKEAAKQERQKAAA